MTLSFNIEVVLLLDRSYVDLESLLWMQPEILMRPCIIHLHHSILSPDRTVPTLPTSQALVVAVAKRQPLAVIPPQDDPHLHINDEDLIVDEDLDLEFEDDLEENIEVVEGLLFLSVAPEREEEMLLRIWQKNHLLLICLNEHNVLELSWLFTTGFSV
ncbi:hypothetical protein RchiOBHm_Chr4g0407701 [Rosa chinensis]|uniref:Uncharacterized protein n=1 Tax=Rosa chinensis TaxID=74649 RepID=A0A2P6QUN3_ROSCH|nr:hypothetical protein RchiOBHm_Chr4g0407701 [Rosa chinensis]